MKMSGNPSLRPAAWLLVAVLSLPGCGGSGGKSGGGTPPPSSADTTPTAFAFTAQSNVAPGTQVESEQVTISGINAAAPVSVSGGEYSIDGQAYGSNAGQISNNQKVRIRVQSSGDSLGEVTATLTIGGVSGSFKVTTSETAARVEAEAATATAGANTVDDAGASGGKAVFAGSAGLGISIAESQDARVLFLAYRADSAGALEATVNGSAAGSFALRATAGAYALASLVTSVSAGDVIAISNPSGAAASETYLDYVEFADSLFRRVSTLAQTTAGTSDGLSFGPDGNLYMSGGPGGSTGQQILRVTPDGTVSVFASGLGSANGSHFDSQGNLYVADYQSNSVRKITPAGVMTSFATGLDGPGGVWVDGDDNVLVGLYGAGLAGNGAKVLKITPGGTVSTYASGGGLRDVVAVVADENGEVYASNWSTGTFYKITGGVVSMFAQTGNSVNQVCYSNGYIYAPSPGGAVVRRISLGGAVELVAGTGKPKSTDGPVADAEFQKPNSCAFNADGTILYVVDRDSGRVRQIDAGTP
ncbi:MAG TPA: hypothetical protein VFL16_14375 [Steroidobacteraceae bacterium]|nr:hypothetical protein [Steroidobacteraceae bacterium]